MGIGIITTSGMKLGEDNSLSRDTPEIVKARRRIQVLCAWKSGFLTTLVNTKLADLKIAAQQYNSWRKERADAPILMRLLRRMGKRLRVLKNDSYPAPAVAPAVAAGPPNKKAPKRPVTAVASPTDPVVLTANIVTAFDNIRILKKSLKKSIGYLQAATIAGDSVNVQEYKRRIPLLEKLISEYQQRILLECSSN